MEGVKAEVGIEGGAMRARVLSTWGAKLRGLLGTKSYASPVLLTGCGSVHTFGMRYPIDVALIGRGGVVLVSRKAVPPWRLVTSGEAVCALERPAAEDPWPGIGTSVRFLSVSVGARTRAVW